MSRTICNPLNLSYRLQTGDVPQDDAVRWPFREAADPSVAVFEGEYYLFASQSGGYWVSPTLTDWTFIPANSEQLPTIGGVEGNGWAPTLLVLDGYLHVLFSQRGFTGEGIYRTKTPKDPNTWELLPGTTGMGWDPQFFYDEDTDRVFISYGCSPEGVITVQELDRRTLVKTGEPLSFHLEDTAHHGWERPGNDNELTYPGWTEGSQLLKHDGVYYLIYSLPSLDNAYANGVYTASSPTGPYTYAPYSPFAQKLDGFIGGAGHGEVFRDKEGRWWNVTCQNIYALHRFERRLGLYPTYFLPDGQIVTDTTRGDYPTAVEGDEVDWQLLSYGCAVTGSSAQPAHGFSMAADENVRTWWSAVTGEPDEWLQLDLGEVCAVHAAQINFAEQDLQTDDRSDDYHQYLLLGSVDGAAWTTLADKSGNRQSVPHDYLQWSEPVRLRYARLVNRHMPFGGRFAVRGLRLFGRAPGEPPAPVAGLNAARDRDERHASLTWEPAEGADGYLVRYGLSPDALCHTRKLWGATAVNLRSLNTGVRYAVRVSAFNRSGVGKASAVENF